MKANDVIERPDIIENDPIVTHTTDKAMFADTALSRIWSRLQSLNHIEYVTLKWSRVMSYMNTHIVAN